MTKADLAMCSRIDCPLSKTCYRHPDSGRKAAEAKQVWF
jgi:hypothetical protein